MAQRQFRTDDTSTWTEKYGSGSDSSASINTSTDATPNTTITGTVALSAGTVASSTGFANGDLVLIHQSQGTGFGTWELNKITTIVGTAWTMAYNFTATYTTGAQVYLLKEYTTATINSGQTLTGINWNGATGGIVALLASTSITVTGNIYVKGTKGTYSDAGGTEGAVGGGYRGGDSRQSAAEAGEGTSGVAVVQTSANGNGGGGANGINGAGGGGGGHVASGQNGRTGGGTGGTGGGTAGAANLTTMVFGGGGGGGTYNTYNTSSGSSGGGIVILIAPTITVTGTVVTNGADTQSSPLYEGGAGAGGSVLIKGDVVVLGTTLVTSAGGAGYTSYSAGSNGRIHVDYGTSISGTSTPTLDSSQDSILVNVTTSIKKVTGVTYATIKKVSGIAIASVKKIAGLA